MDWIGWGLVALVGDGIRCVVSVSMLTEGWDAHLADIRQSEILYRLTARLLFRQFRDAGDEPKLYLFNQLKRIVREWIDGGCLRCTGGTYPAQRIC